MSISDLPSRRPPRIDPRAVLLPGAHVLIGDGSEIHPFALIGKLPKGATARSAVCGHHVTIGRDCQIGPHVTLYRDVEIGDGCLIGDGASIREGARIGAGCLISRCVTINYNVTLGEGCRIMDNSHLTGDTVLGARCFLGPGVMTANDRAIGRLGYDAERVRGPILEDDVAVGIGALILPGVRIGRGAIIGAGALVTRDVAPGVTVYGARGIVVRP